MSRHFLLVITAAALFTTVSCSESGRHCFYSQFRRSDSLQVAEISPEGYTYAIYHGRVPAKIGFPVEFDTAKPSSESEKEQSFFEDPGSADVEGFVVCRSEVFSWVQEPLPDAIVLYSSSADLLYTTTDQHGYFRFEGIKDKKGKVSVSYSSYKAVEATVPMEDDSRWLWVQLERDL